MAKSKNIDEAAKHKDISFEAALSELEALVNKIESDDIPLDAAVNAYERGISLIAICQEKLASVEEKVKILDGTLLKNLELENRKTT